ncbi:MULTISPECIES: antitoxin [unclassified Streptomyces]|uniref:antitoxin n=1 Tax=unclassified Streptomyces TaxID=2593676 RepID=UPI0036681AFA
MSMMDKLKNMLKGHGDQTSKGVDKAGDYVDGKTQNKYQGQVDKGQEALKDRLGNPDQGQQPPQT